ncbi:hypothetical protein QEG73_01055 [Chitinophagaceae bacterium 26-R-25]|nr:hypothetical protein [Chitinophagaceae bacterium 26-R-25]
MAHVVTAYIVYTHGGTGIRHHHFSANNNITNETDENYPGTTDLNPGNHIAFGWPTLSFNGKDLPFAFMSVNGSPDGNQLYTTAGNQPVKVGSADIKITLVYAPPGGISGPGGSPGIWVDAFNVDTGNFSDDTHFIEVLTPPTPPDNIDNTKTTEANLEGDVSTATAERIRASATIDGGVPFVEWKKIFPIQVVTNTNDIDLKQNQSGEIWIAFYQTQHRRIKIPTEGIWTWVDYGTMIDDGIHPWNPDVRYFLTGVVMADLAKYSSPSLAKEFLNLAAKQIAIASKGIVNEISGYANKIEE